MRLTRRSVLRTGALAAMSPWSGAVLWSTTPAGAQGSGVQWGHCLPLSGELKYPAGFRHFDYVNPQAPEGWDLAPGGARHIRQLQPGGRRPQGFVRRRRRHDLRHADGGIARRADGQLRADRRRGRSFPELCNHLLSPACSRTPSRRHPDHGRGRDLFLRGIQENQSLHRCLLSRRRESGEERRARGHLQGRVPRQS